MALWCTPLRSMQRRCRTECHRPQDMIRPSMSRTGSRRRSIGWQGRRIPGPNSQCNSRGLPGTPQRSNFRRRSQEKALLQVALQSNFPDTGNSNHPRCWAQCRFGLPSTHSRCPIPGDSTAGRMCRPRCNMRGCRTLGWRWSVRSRQFPGTRRCPCRASWRLQHRRYPIVECSNFQSLEQNTPQRSIPGYCIQGYY